MQLYTTSIVQRKRTKNGDFTNDFYFQVPSRLLTHLNFNRYDSIYLLFIAPKDFNPQDVKTDEIEIRLFPFRLDEIKELIYCELSMSNMPNAFSYFLDVFKKQNINILDCRAIDSVFNKNGKVELVCQVPMFTDKYKYLEVKKKNDNQDIIPYNLAKESIFEIQNELNTQLNNEIKKLNDRIPGSFYKDFKINLSNKSIDRYLIDAIDKKNKNSHLFFSYRLNSIDIFKVDEVRELYDGSRTLKNKLEIPILPKHGTDSYNSTCQQVENILSQIEGKNFHLGISAESDFNMLQAKFKSLDEIILPFEITLINNSPGELYNFTKSVGDSGINLRMIEPIHLHDATYQYLIQADISQSKYKFFHSHNYETVLDIVKSDVFRMSQRTDTQINFGSGYEKNQNNSQTIIEFLSISVKNISLSPQTKNNNTPIIYSTLEDETQTNTVRRYNCIFSDKEKLVKLSFSVKDNEYITEGIFINKVKEELKDIPLSYKYEKEGQTKEFICKNNEQIELLLYHKITNILIELIAPKFISEYLEKLLISCNSCKKRCREIKLEKCFSDILAKEQLDKMVLGCYLNNGENKADVLQKTNDLILKYKEKYKPIMGKK